MNENKKNDFLAIVVKNPELSLVDFKDAGITTENSSLLSKEEYMAMPKVVEAFTGTNGEFDQKKFDSVYKNSQIMYSVMADDELLSTINRELTYGADSWYAPTDKKADATNPIIVIEEKPFEYSYGIAGLKELSDQRNKLSTRELAQTQKVVDYETGEELDYSPNDKAGLFSWFSLPTMVLAQWDEDGTHEVEGVQVEHKAGDLKLNANDKPYYETLSGRDIYGKELLKRTDILTVDGSEWNKVDIFDSDGTKKGAGKVALELAARVAPLFIPGVGEIYGYISAADAIMRVMPIFGKVVNTIATGDNDNAFGDFLNNWEAQAAKYDPSASDYGQSHFVSFENIANLIGDVSKQLFQQRAVSTIPALIKKAQGVAPTKTTTDVSRGLSLAFMASTSAQQVYGDFKQAGANDKIAALGMLGSTLALYKLMSIDYFRDNIFKNTILDESDIRATTRLASTEVAKNLATSANIATTKEAASFLNKVSNFYENSLVKGISKRGLPGLMARGFSEASEETLEEVTTDLVKATTLALDALGLKTTNEDENLDFGFSASDIAKRYAASFAGGFVGGMVFAGQHRYEKWLYNKASQPSFEDLPSMEKLVFYLANNKRNEIDYYLDSWHDKGVLGSKTQSIDGNLETTLDGAERFIPNTTGMSQNDAVYYTLKNALDTYQQAIDEEIDARYMSEEGMDKLRSLGYNMEEIAKNPRLIGTATLAALKDYDSFQQDFYANLTNVTKLKVALQKRIKDLSPTPATTEPERRALADAIENDSQVRELKKQLKEARDENTAFLSGAKNRYYSGQALFAANKGLNSNFIDLSLDTYVKTKYNRGLSSFTEEQQDKIKEEHKSYVDLTGRNKVYKAYDLYLDLANKFIAPIQEEGERLDAAFSEEEVPTILGLSELAKVAEEQETLREEYRTLEEKPDLTDEEENRKAALSTQIDLLGKKLLTVMNNPELAMNQEATAEALGLFAEGNTGESKLSLADDSDPTKVDITDALLQALRNTYIKDQTLKKYRFDDGELNAFYSGIKAYYKASGGADQRVTNYFLDISKYNDPDTGETDAEIASIVAKDADDPIWFLSGNPASRELPALLDNMMDALGNDADFEAAYDEVKNVLTRDTNFYTNEEADEYLTEFLNSVLPTIKGKNIIDIVEEFKNLKDSISYSAFIEVAKKLGADEKSISLFEALEKERRNLSASSTLQDYVMQSAEAKSTLSAEKLDPIFKVINAVVTGATDGTNDIINNFKHIEGDSLDKLPTLSDRAGKHLLQQAQYFSDEVAYLRALSYANSLKTLRVHKDTALTMNPKFIKRITELSSDFNELWGDFSFSPTENDYDVWQAHFIDFLQAIHDKYEGQSVDDVANSILSLVNVKSLALSPNTLLNTDKDAPIGEIDLVRFLATAASLSAKDFYTAYANTVDQYKREGKDLLPIYGQEYAIRQSIAYLSNPELFNAILEQVKANAPISTEEKAANYEKNKPILYNLNTVLGSAGSGKTIGVIKFIIDMLNDCGVRPEVVFIAKEQEQADKVKDNASPTAKAITMNKFLKDVYGEEISADSYSLKEEHLVSSASEAIVGSVFDSNAGTKLFVVDEIETLSEAELSRLCADAVSEGALIIGAGDLKQPNPSLKVKDGDHTISHTSGIEDCYFTKTPTLTTSMRAQTVAKKENTELMANALDKVLNEAAVRTLDLKERNSLLSSVLNFNTLYYWEDPTTGEIYGDKNVSSVDELDTYINNLSKLGTVAIIYNGDNKFKTYEVKDKVVTVPYEKRAGGEYDYVISAVDFKDVDSRGGNLSSYLYTQDLYTITQRARKGSVVLVDPTNTIFKFKSEETKAQVSSISDSERTSFMSWTMKGLSPYISLSRPTFNLKGPNPGTVTSNTTPGTVTSPAGGSTSGNTQPTATPPVNTPPPSGTPVNGNPPVVNPTNGNPPVVNTPPSSGGNNTAGAPVNGNTASPTGNNGNGAITTGTVDKTVEDSSTSIENIFSPVNGRTTPTRAGTSSGEEAATEETSTSKSTPTEEEPVDTSFEDEDTPARKNSVLKGAFKPVVDYFNSYAPNTKISTAQEFTIVLSYSFPHLQKKFKRIFNTGNTTIADLVNPASSFRRNVTNLIATCYGQPGIDAINSIWASPYKGTLDLEKRIAALSPITNDVSFYGNERRAKRWDHMGSPIEGGWTLYIHEFGKTWNNESVNSYKDIRTISTLSGFFKDDAQGKQAWASFVAKVGSYVRTGYFNMEAFNNENVIFKSKLLAFLKDGKQATWIVPYKKDQSLVTYRFYNKEGNDYFDVPVMIIQGTTFVGEYQSTIDRIYTTKITKRAATHIPLNEFLAKYNLYAGEKAGVITVKQGQAMGNINEASKKYLTDNVGKVMLPITSEIAVRDKVLNADSTYGVFKTGPDGNTVTDYNSYSLVGIQSIISFDSLLRAISIYREKTGFDSDKEILITSNSNESREVSDPDSVANAAFLTSDGEKGKIRQLISQNTCAKLLGLAASGSQNMDGTGLGNIALQLSAFLNPRADRSSKYPTYRWLDISFNGKRYALGVVNGEYCWVTPENGTLTKLASTGLRAGTVINFNRLFRSFGEDYSKKANIPSIALRGMHDYKSKSGDVVHYDHQYSTNWVLSFVFNAINDREIANIKRGMAKDVGKYGVFLDDKASKNSVAPNSYYGILDPGNKTYYVNAELLNSDVYVVNIPGRASVSPERTPAKVGNSLQGFLNNNQLGIHASTVEEANRQLLNNSITWKYKQIQETPTGYEIVTTDDSNINAWFKYKTHINNNLMQDSIDYALNSDVNKPKIHISNNGFIIINKGTKGYSGLQVTPERAGLYKSIIDAVGEDYVLYKWNLAAPTKSMGERIITAIESNLEIAEKIINFEENLRC